VWVFVMVDTCQTPALGYLEVVQVRDAATLLPTIEDTQGPIPRSGLISGGHIAKWPLCRTFRTIKLWIICFIQ